MESKFGRNEHLYITIDANILTKATESKSKRPDPNPENPNEIQIQRLNPDPENPEESKSNIESLSWKQPNIQIQKNPDPTIQKTKKVQKSENHQQVIRIQEPMNSKYSYYHLK